MKKNIIKIVRLLAVIVVVFGFYLIEAKGVFADGFGLTVSPMNQSIVVNPGEVYQGSFKISNPAASTMDGYYEISMEPFYLTDGDNAVFEAEGDSGEIVKWITLNVPESGILAPNEVKEVSFTIDVPDNAPAGGQYVSFLVTTKNDVPRGEEGDDMQEGSSGAMINETRRMAHLVYAEVTGSTIKSGVISEANVPSFLLSGDIRGTSLVKNTGNVHGKVSYKLQVFPLFSDEEIYTTEEESLTRIVLPNRSVYDETVWDNTPSIGIFNVVYTVEFEGSKAEVSKMVIICPIWLLFIIFFVIAAIIIWLVMRARSRRHAK